MQRTKNTSGYEKIYRCIHVIPRTHPVMTKFIDAKYQEHMTKIYTCEVRNVPRTRPVMTNFTDASCYFIQWSLLSNTGIFCKADTQILAATKYICTVNAFDAPPLTKGHLSDVDRIIWQRAVSVRRQQYLSTGKYY